MFEKIIEFSVKRKIFIAMMTLFLIVVGLYSMFTIPIDAVPDITNNQVQIVTISPTLAPQEVEQLITFPIEVSMSNIMNVEEIRSVSRFGMSLVTVVFEEGVPMLNARQLINEQIQTLGDDIPSELGVPELMPVTTGLGEIYQYVLEVDPEYKDKYDAMELRTIQDWVVKRQLAGIPGIVEINSFGGFLKEYEVAIDPDALFSLNITIPEVFEALHKNNQNTGGSYIEKGNHAYYIRSEGMINNIADIEDIVIANRDGIPIYAHDIADIKLGSPKRFGAMTMDGEGECVGGIAMMLKGANANKVTAELEKRVEKVQKLLPEGVSIKPYLNRSELVSRNISTVIKNLIEGAIIVFIVLIIFLGNIRAGLIVASVIPLSMLFGFIMMKIFGVSANLMSLGAIDFGIVIDGSIVLVEGMLAHLYTKKFFGHKLDQNDMNNEITKGTNKVVNSATFAVLIILIVFFPILMLQGIEGKYFSPMAKTLVFCIIGAMILSLTYVPMMCALFLKKKIKQTRTFADIFFEWLDKWYQKLLNTCIRFSFTTVALVFLLFGCSLFIFSKLGAEFIPTLDEGDFAMQMTLPAGSSLSKSIETSTKAEKILVDKFPEIKNVVSKIGTAEVPTDPMSVEDADIMIMMKPFSEWTSAKTRAEMVDKMKDALEELIDDVEFNFSQPIQLRFNELITGAKADIAIKLYGEDMTELSNKAKEVASIVEKIDGADDVIVEQTMGLPQVVVSYDRKKIGRYGVNIEELNTILRTAYAGEASGKVFENERRFNLVVRLNQATNDNFNLDKLFIRTESGAQVPLSELMAVKLIDGPLQINRDETKRRIVVGVNVRDADIKKVVENIQASLDKNIKLKPGYYFEYGGQFENLQNAIDTLTVVIPIALILILVILLLSFRSVISTLIVFSTVPLSIIGGILALWLRGLPFSISAGVGFIALFGVAVLNGILMLNHFKQLSVQNIHKMSTNKIIKKGTHHLLRPVFLTGAVASLGFVPMAIATSAGAEVQRPLATVVIGGLLLSTVLTLVMIPVFYYLSAKSTIMKYKIKYNYKHYLSNSNNNKSMIMRIVSNKMSLFIATSAILLSGISCSSKSDDNNLTNEVNLVESDESQNRDYQEEELSDDNEENLEDDILNLSNVMESSSYNGVIVMSPQQQSTVTLSIDGIVKNTNLIPGQFVKKGELLAKLENPEFINLQQSYLEALAQSEFLETEFNRQEELLKEDLASRKIYQQAKADYLSMKSKKDASAAQLTLLGLSPSKLENNGIVSMLEVYAPISGYISNLNMNNGKHIPAGDPLCEIIDKANSMIKLTVYEKDLRVIKEGDKIKFSVNGLGKEVFFGDIVSIGQNIDFNNRSVEVYIKVLGDNSLFRPGMYVNAQLTD